MAVDRERRRLLRLSPGGVVIAPRVYTFGRLEMLLTGSLTAGTPVSGLGRDMVFERLIEKEKTELGWPIQSIGPGLRQRIITLLDQLKISRITPEVLTRIAKGNIPEEKLAGLVRVYSAYEDFLSQGELSDQADNRQRLIEALTSGAPFSALAEVQEIIIRDFNRLTPWQVELVHGLAGAVERVEVHFSCPDWIFEPKYIQGHGWTGNPFEETLFIVRGLESSGEDSGGLELFFKQPPGTNHSALSWLTQNLFHPAPPPGPAPQPAGRIEILAAPGRYKEVEEIGRRIWALIDQGVLPERIALSVRDLGVYGQLVEDVFRRFHLPLFFRRGAPLAIQSPVRALLSLLRLSRSHWDRHLVLDVLSSPYLDSGITISWPKAAQLSAQAGVTDERAGGGWEKNLNRLTRVHPEKKPDINTLLGGVRRIRSMLKPLAKPQTWSGFRQAVLEILTELKLDERIKRGSGANLHRDALAWADLQECLDELVLAARQSGLGREVFPPEVLERTLRQAIKERNIGQSGQGAGGIMVLNAFDLQGLHFDYLFLAGLNEGEFPRPGPENSLLSDAEMTLLNKKAGRRILQTAAAEYRREELLFYHALSAAREKIVLSYSRMDEEGRVRLPSALLDEVIRLWPDDTLDVVDLPARITPALEAALTQEELYGTLAAGLLTEGGGREEVLAREVLAGLLTRPDHNQRWRSLARRAVLEQQRGAGLVSDFTGRIGSLPVERWLKALRKYEDVPLISPTFFEEFGQCPFLFWGRRIISLAAPEEIGDEIRSRDEGSLLHRILQVFLNRCKEEEKLPLCGDPAEIEILSTIAEEEWRRAEENIALGREPLWRIRCREEDRILRHWLKQEQGRGDDFIPTYFEWEFGPGRKKTKAAAPPLEVQLISGDRLFFHGRLDRIDVGKKGIRIIDYKNSGNATKYNRLLKVEELGRTSFQAPLYQAAVAAALGRPVQAAWVLLRDFKPKKSIKLSPPTDSDFFDVEISRRRILLEEEKDNFFNRLEDAWLRMTGGVFSPDPDNGPCDYCEFKTVCRSVSIAGDES